MGSTENNIYIFCPLVFACGVQYVTSAFRKPKLRNTYSVIFYQPFVLFKFFILFCPFVFIMLVILCVYIK